MKLFSIGVCVLFLALGSALCNGDLFESTLAQGQSSVGTVTDSSSLLSKLRAAGAKVEIVGEVDQPFLSITGTMIKLRGEDVQLFQYSSAAQMEAEAKLISRDGNTVGTKKIHWIGAPHFFKQGRILVLYVGDEKKVEEALETALGPQFAGQ